MNWPEFYSFVLDREARVVHQDPRDPGGMTAWGISRRYNPTWPGWDLVNQGIVSGQQFEAAVERFYLALCRYYWSCMGPRLREAFCDALINMGSGKKGDRVLGAVELLQHAMNRLAGSDYVTVDGVFGAQTRAALKTVDAGALAFTLCALRCAEYAARDGARYYLGGWIKRVGLIMEAI